MGLVDSRYQRRLVRLVLTALMAQTALTDRMDKTAGM
jgi:hypothetical protein